MFSIHKLPTSLITGLVLCLQSAYAQNTSEVSLSFVSFPKSAEHVTVKLSLGDGKLLDVEAPSKWLSPAVRVKPMANWVIGETADGPDGKPIFRELGRTKAPASSQQILLLVRKGRDNADGFDLVALDARTNEFGAGKYLFMNAAKVDVAGVIGDDKFVIKPNQHQILTPKIPRGEHTVHTALYFRKGDEARPFFSSEWRISNDARNLVFFYHDPQTTHIRLHTIKDYIP
jgi:hypothetical protein